jgi:L-ribulokinase
VYAWFKNLLSYLLKYISDEKLREEFTAVIWLNGRRTQYANQLLKGAVINLNPGSDAPHIFKAHAEYHHLVKTLRTQTWTSFLLRIINLVK